MTYPEICAALENPEIPRKERFRLLTLASTRPDLMEHCDYMQNILAASCGMNEEEAAAAFRKAEEQWRQKVLLFQEQLTSLFIEKRIYSRIRRGWKSRILPLMQVEQLYIVPVSLILQQLSRTRCRNHLHKKDLTLLLFLLKNPAHLKKAARHFEEAVTAASRMQISCADTHYLFYTLAFVQVCADYMNAMLSAGLGGRTAVIKWAAEKLHTMDTAQLQLFLAPPGAADSAS